jgi:hypothetical protein
MNIFSSIWSSLLPPMEITLQLTNLQKKDHYHQD